MNWHELHPKDLVLREDQNQIKKIVIIKKYPLKISLFFRLSSSVEIRLKQTSYCSHLCSVWEQQELSPLLAVGCCTVVFSPRFCQVRGKSAWITFPLLGARNQRTSPAPVCSRWCPKPHRIIAPEMMLPRSLPWCLSTADLQPLSLG